MKPNTFFDTRTISSLSFNLIIFLLLSANQANAARWGKYNNTSTNSPPELTFNTEIFELEAGQDFRVSVQASDPDGRVRHCHLSVNGGESFRDRYAPYEWYGPRDTALTNMAAGEYAISVSCRDNSRLTTTISKTLVVSAAATNSDPDTTAPTLSLPTNITTEALNSLGRQVNYSASAIDDTDTNPSLSCTPASGSTFPIGSTTVNCNASDISGNTANGSFLVSVIDISEPEEPLTPVVESHTVQVQWAIPVTRTDGSPLSPTDLHSYTLAYSSNPALDAATIVDIPASENGTMLNAYAVTLPSTGTYFLGMTASDNQGNMSDLSEIIEISIP